jgi:hypothetical protein
MVYLFSERLTRFGIELYRDVPEKSIGANALAQARKGCETTVLTVASPRTRTGMDREKSLMKTPLRRCGKTSTSNR